jgi:hypothetical protein
MNPERGYQPNEAEAGSLSVEETLEVYRQSLAEVLDDELSGILEADGSDVGDWPTLTEGEREMAPVDFSEIQALARQELDRRREAA